MTAPHVPFSSGITAEARLENLHGLLDWLAAACAEAGVGEEAAFALHLAAEEVCANVIRHGYGPAPGPIRLHFHADEHCATVTVEDDAPVFDPAVAPDPDLSEDWEARRIGGLGWHLVYELADAVRYEALAPQGNRLVLSKRYAPPQSNHATTSHA
jgi:serine/threonine-protein kinase RsbW